MSTPARFRHSHTEIADRLFSLMKRLFETDGAARVRGVGCFAELEEKLREEFESCKEEFDMEFGWANWDFEEWLSNMSPVKSSIFEGKLARF